MRNQIFLFLVGVLTSLQSEARLLPPDSPRWLPHEVICVGEGCEEDDTVRPSTQAEYVQSKILAESNVLDGKMRVQNMNTGEVVEISLEDPHLDFLRPDGSFVDELQQARYAVVPNYYFPSGAGFITHDISSKALSRMATWNECTGNILGRYILGKRCSSRPVHTSLMKVMNELPKILKGKKVQLIHKGVMGDANHRDRRSLHNTGRAVDVVEILVDGRRYAYSKAVSNSRSMERGVYEQLMKGWEAAVKRHCGSVVAATAIHWTDRNHRQHIHLGTTYNCN